MGKIDKRQQQLEESVRRYLDTIKSADRTSPIGFDLKTVRLHDKIALLRQRMREREQIKEQLKKEPDRQLSLTYPDSRSMASGGKETGTVGYDVQTVVDTKHHLIVEHERRILEAIAANAAGWRSRRRVRWASRT